MNCNIIKDLLPLYIDGCCSEESKKAIEEHLESCAVCKDFLREMKEPAELPALPEEAKAYGKLNAWKSSVLQSVLLLLSFGLITAGVALEARTPIGFFNGFWAVNLVIPATGFMLSLTNWYFVRLYKSRKCFSNCALLATLSITLSAYIWSGFHYEINLFDLFAGNDFANVLEILHALLLLNGIGILLTVVFCTLSKTLSSQYAKMLGKE